MRNYRFGYIEGRGLRVHEWICFLHRSGDFSIHRGVLSIRHLKRKASACGFCECDVARKLPDANSRSVTAVPANNRETGFGTARQGN
jgi:hypothetical protein